MSFGLGMRGLFMVRVVNLWDYSMGVIINVG